MSYRSNRDPLLRDNFQTVSQQVDLKMKDMTYNMEQAEDIARQIKQTRQTDEETMYHFKTCVRSIEDALKDIEEDLLDRLDQKARDAKERNIAAKVRTGFERTKNKYLDAYDGYETIVKSTKIVSGQGYGGGGGGNQNDFDGSIGLSSTTGGEYYQQQDQEEALPVIQVYDQKKYVKKRSEQVKAIKQDARDLNQVAQTINTKIHDHDNMLDDLEKRMVKDVEVIKDANEELVVARERQQQGNKNVCWCFLVIILLVVVIVVASIFVVDGGGGGSSSGGGSGSSSRRILGNDFEALGTLFG